MLGQRRDISRRMQGGACPLIKGPRHHLRHHHQGMTRFMKLVLCRPVLKNVFVASQEADQLDDSQEADRRNQLDEFVVNQPRRKRLGCDLLHRRQGTALSLKQLLRL